MAVDADGEDAKRYDSDDGRAEYYNNFQ